MKQIAWIMFGFLGWVTATEAASFDCGKATSKVEKLVCDNPIISALDDTLGRTYQGVLNQVTEEQKQHLLTEQRHWLKHNRNACTDVPCMKQAYWSRLAELEAFFQPRAPVYKNESDKAEPIKKVIATAPLYPMYDNSFCRQIFDDLKQMNGVNFVEPTVQAQSYEDESLDSFKEKRKGYLPLNAEVSCEPRLDGDDPDGSLGICQATYGLPPYRIFELPPIKPSGEQRFFISYDTSYGPMNISRYKPGMGDRGAFLQIGTSTAESANFFAIGTQPSYNSIIEYQHQYYFLTLANMTGSFWLSVESVRPIHSKEKIICSWSPVKVDVSTNASKKPPKKAKPVPADD